MEGKKFEETEFRTEDDFERIIKENSRRLFGEKTVYFDLKNKVDTKFLGATIPDSFLFDFKDQENPEFYMVEIELARHDFYKHIFPQITKFFAFFKNSKSRSELTDKLYSFITSNQRLNQEFKNFLGKKEIYKTVKESIENSQNILLIIDENKPEFQEVMETYTDTWDKIVKLEIFKQYSTNNKTILQLNPDFEDIGLAEPIVQKDEEEKYDESFHLEGANNSVIAIFKTIKHAMNDLDKNIKFNPQKYYISLRKNRNFAYLDFKRRKIKIAVMLPLKVGKKVIKNYKLRKFTEGIKRFYGHDSFEVTVDNEANLREILNLLALAYKEQET
jgi:predicted transport protein